MKYFLGIEVAHSKKGIAISQRKYVPDMLDEVGLLLAAPISFPIEQNLKLTATEGKPLKNPTQYWWLVEKLIYLTITKPDVQFMSIYSAISCMNQESHLNAAIRFLRYLKGSSGQSLFSPKQNNMKFIIFCNADRGSCSITRRSLMGYCVFLRCELVSWKIRKQKIVSRSSVEVEYRAIADVTCG